MTNSGISKISAKPPSPATPLSALSRAGIHEPAAVLAWVPRKHVSHFEVPPSAWSSMVGQKVCAALVVLSLPLMVPGENRFVFDAKDTLGRVHTLTVFGVLRYSPWAYVSVGAHVRVIAKVGVFNGQVQLNGAAVVPQNSWDKIVAVYRGIPGKVAADRVATAVAYVLGDPEVMEDAILDVRVAFGGLPEPEILQTAGVSPGRTLRDVFVALHTPQTVEQGQWGLRAARQLAVAQVRHKAAQAQHRIFSKEAVIRISAETRSELVRALPFALTKGERSQESAIAEIFAALAEPTPMDAVLSADVGVGKTLCYMLPAVALQAMGRRVAILIPNGILVEQVAKEFASMFPSTPVAVITDGVKAKQINWDANPVLVGTTALFKVARAVSWVADFLVVDEQQKTSRDQRDTLRAPHTNMLECTATALPRTMALITHGGQQLIQVSAKHAVQTIHTQVVKADARRDVFLKIREVLNTGGQVAIIYPRVQGQSDGDLKSVVEAGVVWEQRFPGQVAVLHGKMTNEEKSRVMNEVKSGAKRVLVSSTIIEIGVTIAALRLLLVVHAERYGVSTLHQMRGRLVRHGGEGWCYLYLPDAVEDDTLARLRLMEQTTDGFRLAEMDMDQRGFGDLGGDSADQSGASFTFFRDLRLMPHDFASTS